MDYQIKAFKDLSNDELYQLLKARVDIFVVEQECPYPEIDNYDQIATHIFLRDNQDIVANVRILPTGTRYRQASIGRVLVTQKYRKQRHARNIMEYAINYIQDEWNEPEIKIQAQAYLKTFYASLGFKQITEEYLEDQIPHIDMTLEKKKRIIFSN